MTYVFGGTLSLTQSINHDPVKIRGGVGEISVAIAEYIRIHSIHCEAAECCGLIKKEKEKKERKKVHG